MDLSANTGTLPTHTAFGEPVLEKSHCQAESGGTISLQLLEFKACLLEVIEELHIRRDAETRYEDQISKLVLEKQELEWEKESLQHQIKTAADQHTELLTNVKKQFQAKIRSIEEEKGKYQVTAELKDKEMNNLKEELKSLQLLKYNLEKTSSELEQKLALQTRTKDTHLNQLGEVEKRFSALSRQCAMVKHAHEKLEQNVDEAMRINEKLTSANQKQEATIVLLTKELGEVSKKLIKVKMTSVRHDKIHSPSGREHHVQELHQKLNMETEMNKKLREENLTERAEKRELMKSLQHTQQLLLCQTQTVGRIETELKTQTEMYQAFQQEHEVMREKSKALEDKVAQLTETYTASKTTWDKEKVVFLDRIKREKEALQTIKEAYEELQQKHTELTLQMKDNSVSTQQFSSVVQDVRDAKTLNEPNSVSELPGFSSLQHLVSSPAKNPERLEDTGAVSELAALSASGGKDQDNHHLRILNHPAVLACPLTTSDLSSHCNNSETNSEVLTKNMNNSEIDIVSDLTVSKDVLQSKLSHVSGNTTASSPECESMDESGKEDLLTKEKYEEGDGGINEGKLGREIDGKQHSNTEQVENIAEQQNREEFKEDVNDAGEKRTVVAQTTDRADMHEDNVGSAEGTGKTRNPETEDKADGEVTDGVKERGQTAEHAAETQIPTQTTTDTSQKSLTWQVNDFMDAEPLTACEPSHISQKVTHKDADSSSLNKEVCADEHQRVTQNVLPLCQDAEPLNQSICQAIDPSKETADEVLIQLPTCTSQINVAPQDGQSPGNTDFQEQKSSQTETETCNPSDIITNVKQADETSDTCVSEECVLVKKLTELQPLSQSREPAAQESGQLMSDGKDGADQWRESQSGGSNTCDTGMAPGTTSCLEETKAAPQPEPAVQHENREKHIQLEKLKEAGNAEITKRETDLKPSAFPSPENDSLSKTDSDESFLSRKKTHRPLFEWGTAQRKIQSSKSKSDVSALHQFIEGAGISAPHTTGPGEIHGHPLSTIPTFIKNKSNKVPLVMTRTSDLCRPPSVSSIAASSRGQQQGEWEAKEETRREATEAEMDRRASLCISSLPVSTSSSVESKVSWKMSAECSRAPSSAAGPGPESIWEPSCSQERENQQSSFRAQISIIEQFLNTERLRLPKRRRTEN
ncbi:paramyosin-like isoform X2 [Melanotaenia boesemani]|uniref:paramyosin-like isoform X2 n=1 Tax=Melanotaenia boesemani TaxID=1250792 RepID=UPI001C04D0E8|nr:paramyosin-like isoform X2 [Melanotaenia boesemani]